MSSPQQPNSGAVPTSSGRNRFASKRLLVVAAAVLAVVILGALYGVTLATRT